MKFRWNRWIEQIVVWSVLGVLFLSSILIISLDAKRTANMPEQELINVSMNNKTNSENTNTNQSQNNNGAFDNDSNEDNSENLGQSSNEEQGYFPKQILAPFVDMVSWVDTASDYSIFGVPDLKKFYNDTGCKYYNLGFIRCDNNQPLNADGSIRWCWGGYYGLSPKGNDGYQYLGILKSIQNIREAGGDIIVSVGGQLGAAPWTITTDVTDLKNMYLEIIETYNLKRLDLDIEEINQGYANNVANAKAIKKVQDETGIEIVLTIPIMPYGWTETQKNLLRAYFGAGVNLTIINNMTMCYGAEVEPKEDFAEASIRATDNAKDQLIAILKEYSVDFTDEQAYSVLGATVDIGYENQANPIFTADLTQAVADYAKEKNLAMFSYWCMNRDSLLQYNSAIDTQYEHYNASKSFIN